MSSTTPKLLMSGPQAVSTAMKVLYTAQPCLVSGPGGTTLIQPGVMWGDDKILITANDGAGSVVFLVGSDLYEQAPAAFLQSEFLDALAKGAATAMPMAELAKVEIALLEGIFAPGGINLLVFVAKVGMFIVHNRDLLRGAYAKSMPVTHFIRRFKHRYPTLYSKMTETAWGAVSLRNFVSGISAEDIAFFLGRLLRGYFFDGHYLPKLKISRGMQLPLDPAWMRVPKLKSPSKWIHKITHNFNVYGGGAATESVISMIVSTFLLVLGLHSPGIGLRAIHNVAEKTQRQMLAAAKDDELNLKKRLGVLGLHLSATDGAAIYQELFRRYKDTPEFLTDGIAALSDFDAVMQPLLANWERMSG